MPAIPDPAHRSLNMPPRLTIKPAPIEPKLLADLTPGRFFALYDEVTGVREPDGAPYVLLGDAPSVGNAPVPRMKACVIRTYCDPRKLDGFPAPNPGEHDILTFGRATKVVELVLEEATFRERT